nr:hypothetical protein [Tanacetum cinerariifolium]
SNVKKVRPCNKAHGLRDYMLHYAYETKRLGMRLRTYNSYRKNDKRRIICLCNVKSMMDCYDDYGLGKHWKNDEDYCYNLAWIQGKAIMTDVASASFGNSSHPRPSFSHAPSFQDLFRDAIHRDFFLISHGPCYALYPEGGVAGSCEFSREEWDAPHQPPLAKAKEDRKKNIKSLSKNLDQMTAKVSCLSVTLNQATVLKVERDVKIFWLKASPSELTSFFQGGLQSLFQKFLASDEFSRVGKLLSLDVSAGFERGLSMHQTQEEFDMVLNKISHFVPGAQGRLAEASPLESTLTPISLSLELPLNDALFLYVTALGQNEERVNAMVDMPDNEMADRVVNESTKIFM